MKPPRVKPEDYIQFVLATPTAYSATEAERVQPPGPDAPSHDAFTRLLNRLEPEPAELWREVKPLVVRTAGWLVVDDTTLDKPYAKHMGLVCSHWSGRHKRVVSGINLTTLVWTDGDRVYPTDYRLYAKHKDGKTKNDHLRDMLAEASARGFKPSCVLFDGWFASSGNLKAVRKHGWHFLARLPSNRKLRVAFGEPTEVSALEVPPGGVEAWLPEFGLVRVFRTVAPDGDAQHWATNDLGMTELGRLAHADKSWQVEEYHRGIKQHTGVDRCQCRDARAQRNHIGFSLRAFVRLEYHRFTTGVSWFEAKMRVIRGAVRAYLSAPWYHLPQPATA